VSRPGPARSGITRRPRVEEAGAPSGVDAVGAGAVGAGAVGAGAVGEVGAAPSLVTWRPRTTFRTSVVWWMPLALIVASEYKLRRRANDAAAAGSVDPFIVLELGVYAFVGVFLLLQFRPRLRPNPVLVWMVGWCLTAAVSTLYAPSTVFALVRGAQLVVIVVVVLQFVRDADLSAMRRFVHGYVGLVSVSILIGLAYVAPTSNEQRGRFTWLFTHSVVAGAMLAFSTILLFTMWLTHRVARLPWARWVYGALLVVNAVSLIRSRTRGSIGATILAIIVVLLLWLRASGKRDLLITSVVALSAIALTVGGPIVSFYLRDSDASELASFNNRTLVWTIAADIIQARPLHGMGLTASRTVFLEDTGLGGAHNAYLNVLVDVGLLGMFWWGGLVLLVLAGGWRLRRRVRRTEGASPLTFDTLAIVGLMVCQIVNAITAEYVAAGVSAAAMVLYMTAVWVVVVEDSCDELGRT